MKNPIRWIGHRGLCLTATENTREAFDAGIRAGFRSFETDLRISADGHLVLSHDRKLNRIADTSLDLHQSLKSELQSLTLKNGEKLLFFEDLLLHYLDFHWTLDFKPDWGKRAIERFIEIVAREKLESWVLTHVKFLVWKKEHEWLLKGHFPKARFYARGSECRKVGLALVGGYSRWIQLDSTKTYGLPPQFWIFNFAQKKVIEFFHSRGCEILAYLPRSESETKAAMQAGFDEILSDRPPLLGPSPESSIA